MLAQNISADLEQKFLEHTDCAQSMKYLMTNMTLKTFSYEQENNITWPGIQNYCLKPFGILYCSAITWQPICWQPWSVWNNLYYSRTVEHQNNIKNSAFSHHDNRHNTLHYMWYTVTSLYSVTHISVTDIVHFNCCMTATYSTPNFFSKPRAQHYKVGFWTKCSTLFIKIKFIELNGLNHSSLNMYRLFWWLF